MIFKKRRFILTILIIITIQFLIYKNNSQKFTFRYFIWNTNEASMGQLITISFISGLFFTTILNFSIEKLNNKSNKKNIKSNDDNIEDSINEEDYISDTEIPPQRDVRDPQPTISVNYRVIKNNEKKIPKYDENIRDNNEYEEDWISKESEW